MPVLERFTARDGALLVVDVQERLLAAILDRDRITRFLGAVQRATQYMLNHPAEAKALFAGHAPDLSDALNAAAWDDTFGRFALSPAAVDHGRYARFEAFLRDAGLIDSVLPVSALATDPGA